MMMMMMVMMMMMTMTMMMKVFPLICDALSYAIIYLLTSLPRPSYTPCF